MRPLPSLPNHPDRTVKNIETVPIDSISHDPANVRKRTDKNLDAIKASLRRFGQQKALVVDGNGIVRAGNGTLRAARELGWEEIAIVRTDLVGSEATAFAIADNQSATLSEWNETALAETLEALRNESPDLIDAAGFDTAEIDAMLGSIADGILDASDASDPLGGDPGSAGEEEDDDGESLKYELTFETAEQHGRWLDFLAYIKSKPIYNAATVAGRLDRYLILTAGQ